MYGNKLAVAIKHNGKVLREHKDTVYLPFGQEFTILIKNLNSVRASVLVSIDGQDVLCGSSLVIAPNSEMELKRYLNNVSSVEGNAFKFIERTAGIEEHRGVKIDDGIIRIEYQFEDLARYQKASNAILRGWDSDYDRRIRGTPLPEFIPRPDYTLTCMTPTSTYNEKLVATATSTATPQLMNQAAEAGITVPGQVVEQKFETVGWFPKQAETHALVIRMLGESPTGAKVEQPVTVKHKPKCTTCGHLNKQTSKFCSECGTALNVL